MLIKTEILHLFLEHRKHSINICWTDAQQEQQKNKAEESDVLEPRESRAFSKQCLRIAREQEVFKQFNWF